MTDQRPPQLRTVDVVEEIENFLCVLSISAAQLKNILTHAVSRQNRGRSALMLGVHADSRQALLRDIIACNPWHILRPQAAPVIMSQPTSLAADLLIKPRQILVGSNPNKSVDRF
ncbi:MAG: hypothetical protein HUU20_23110 [Pirellulales bacterium]|nr:hypothetical protein [Pirellulales bacterium]